MNKCGFFISSRAHAWLGSRPPGSAIAPNPSDDSKFSLDSLQEIVYEDSFPSGFRIKAARDGYIALGFEGVPGFISEKEAEQRRRPEENWSLTLLNARIPVGEAINAYLACLNGALQKSSDILELESVPTNRLGQVDDELMPKMAQTTDIWRRLQQREAVFYEGNKYKLVDAVCLGRHKVIEVSDLKAAAQGLEHLLQDADKGALKVVSLYNLALGSLSQLDFARSLITSWAVTERLLEIIWLKFISINSAENAERVLKPPTSGQRANKLKGNNLTASIRVEILSVGGHLSEKEYTFIEKARRARNAWIHALDPVSFYSAMDAAAAAAILIKRVYGIEVQTKYQVWGQ